MKNIATRKYVQASKDGHFYMFRWHDENDMRIMCLILMSLGFNSDCNLTFPEVWEIANRMTG